MKMNIRKPKVAIMFLVAIAALIAFSVFLVRDKMYFRTRNQSQKQSASHARLKKNRHVSNVKPTLERTGQKHGDKPEFEFDSEEHPYSEKDKQLARDVQKALDDDDYDAVLAATEVALKAKNPDVRLRAIEALGWYGEQALPELTVCMADPDDDVAQAALGHWEQGVSEIEDPSVKLKVSLYAISTITDEDTLTMVASHFSSAALDLIDGEEDETGAAQKRLDVVQSLVDVIEGGKEKCAAAAREAYEDITGSKWISIDEAEKYLSDPDNYEAPESAEGN